MCDRRPFECIVPPHILERLLDSKDRHVREAALKTLLTSTQIRTQRSLVGALAVATAAGEKRRTIYDAKNMEPDPPSGTLVRSEGGKPSKDAAVNEAYDGLGATYDFYRQVLDRNSLDGTGMRLDAVVHYGDSFNNAFWDGQRMVFGDGDGELFGGFTKSLDVIAHELTHGVTEFTAGLEYHNQPGALNESVSDAFGSVVKQWSKQQQTADAADWLIGAEIFTPTLAGDALRSLKAPGTAYDNPLIGKDPQPARMSDFRTLPDTRAATTAVSTSTRASRTRRSISWRPASAGRRGTRPRTSGTRRSPRTADRRRSFRISPTRRSAWPAVSTARAATSSSPCAMRGPRSASASPAPDRSVRPSPRGPAPAAITIRS